MDFEYDPKKSELNKIKHGIDFGEAKAIWLDENAFQVDTAPGDEERFLVIGNIGGILWTAVITFRDERIRIISVRRARSQEVKQYDNRKGIRREV
jgi:uncharacterized protein